jgi:hypothetical protein
MRGRSAAGEDDGMTGNRFAALGLLAFLAAGHSGCSRREPSISPAEPRLRFSEAAAARGLERVLRSGSPEKLTILENVGTGGAFLDADGDGRLDIFLANAGVLEAGSIKPGPGSALYLQGADGRFADITREAGLEYHGWGTGVAVGDIDNDGDLDICLTGFGRTLLYLNQGAARFEEVSRSAGLVEGSFGTSAVFVDYDADGLLDLYVANYVRFDPAAPPNAGEPCIENGVPVACGPGFCDPAPDFLYHNQGAGRFRERGAEAGINRAEGAYGLGVAAGDLDGDGLPDLYVANDTTANFLWRNLGGGRFEESGIYAGAALSEEAQGQAGMGVALGDAGGSHRLDIFVSNYSEEHNAFYRNLGGGGFEERTAGAGLKQGESFLALGWGAVFADLDNDADLDLVVANGHVHPRAGEANPALSYLQRCFFLLNDGRGRFEERGRALGEAAAAPRAHRGLAAGDIDGDGDIDLLITVLDGPAVLLINEGERLGRALRVRLEGRRSNREGIGARLWLSAGGKAQMREVSRGGSYLSSSDALIHFGLGGAARAESLRVRWPSGLEETVGPLEAGFVYVLVEGSGQAVAERPLAGR